jgi:hypothetical protein
VVRIGLLLLCLLTSAPASAKATLTHFVLPSRRAGAPARAARLERMAATVSQRLAVERAAVSSDVDVAPAVNRAKSLALEVKLDEAAALIDETLARAMSRLDRLSSPSPFVSGHLDRISIAIARNEGDKITQLFDRLLKFDPAFALAGDERRPRLSQPLESARKRLAPTPTLSADDLGASCRAADVVLAARGLDASTLEIFRFDRCQLVARATSANEAGDAAAAAELSKEPFAGAPAAVTVEKTRKIYWVPLGLGIGAIAIGAVGAGLTGSAAADYYDLRGQCGQTGDCAPSSADTARAKERAGYALIGIAGALAVTSVIVWLVQRRHHDVVHAQAGGFTF